MSNYYTPDISAIHVGLECQVRKAHKNGLWAYINGKREYTEEWFDFTIVEDTNFYRIDPEAFPSSVSDAIQFLRDGALRVKEKKSDTDLVRVIENRIKNEYKKHHSIEWEKIAAKKIIGDIKHLFTTKTL